MLARHRRRRGRARLRLHQRLPRRRQLDRHGRRRPACCRRARRSSGRRSSTSSPPSSSAPRWPRPIGTGMIDLDVVTVAVILAGLVGAIVWDLITWYYGLPTSSSHALIGGYAGAARGQGRARRPSSPRAGRRRSSSSSLAPLIGLVLGLAAHDRPSSGSSARSTPAQRRPLFRRLQLVSAALFSLGHGANDAQKTMGIIAGVLFAGGLPAATLRRSRSGWSWPRTRRSALGTLLGRLAHHPHDGLEDHQAAAGRRLRRRDRRGAVALFIATSLGRRRSARRTRSPARSSASARRAACRRCAGASPARSSGPGC